MGNKKQKGDKNIVFIGSIIILIGLIIFIIALWGTNVYEAIENNRCYMIIFNFIADIGKTIMTVGAGTVLYSYYDFVNYIKKILINIVIENNYVDDLSDDKKREIISRLEKQVIYGYEISDENTLYDFVNKEIQSLVKNIHYESMSLNINCRLSEQNKIEKDFIREFVCNFDVNQEYEIDLAFMTKCSFVKNDEIKTPFVIEEFQINGKNLINEIEMKCSEKDGAENSVDTYTTTYYYDFKNDNLRKAKNYIENKDKNIVKIFIKYKTVVPIEDNALAYRVYVPCKKFDAILVYDENIKEVFTDIFAFKDRKLNDRKLDTNRVSYSQNRNCISVSFKDWILPGDGIMYIFSIK
ncbi:MAG: hypothetical protein HFJ10_04925 [Lachnospiraceae bacterium]|nr:hypothetical protein [Lachnospiraceae bacterium]